MKIDRQHFSDLLNNGKYDDAIIEAAALRELPYGKNAVIDYILAISFCMKGEYVPSKNMFARILSTYSLKKEEEAFLKNERSNCMVPNPNKTKKLIANFSINYAPLPEAGAFGKGGFTLDCRNKSYKSNIGVSIDELESRLFTIDQKKEALAKVSSIVGDRYVVDSSGRFIVVSLKSNGQDLNVKKVTDKLENAYRFYLSTYQLRPSDKLITVYLLPDRSSLRTVAEKAHKLLLDYNTIGYSSLADLSILGIANPNSVGTLYHELFHLTIRTDVGDIPAWLDEGIASLYSVYVIKDNSLFGSEQTWRIQHFKLLTLLNKNNLSFPSIEQLLRMSWFEFEGGDERNSCISSIHYALANMFLLYLQEKNKVYEMVLSFKNRSINPQDSSKFFNDNIDLVEKVMRKSIGELTADYYKWIDEKYNINLLKLTQKKPYADHRTNSRELPDYVIDLGTQIDSLITISQDMRSVNDSIDLNKIKYRKQELLNTYKIDFYNYSERYANEMHNLNSEVEKNDANDYSSPQLNDLRKKLVAYENELKHYVELLNTYINKKQ